MLCHVNLIPLNTVDGRDYRKSGKDAIRNFVAVLEKRGFPATVRRKLGSDIDASCGQLRASKIEENNY
jgi:23S rRNA (adenine2503-C2)-methyltransferase